MVISLYKVMRHRIACTGKIDVDLDSENARSIRQTD